MNKLAISILALAACGSPDPSPLPSSAPAKPAAATAPSAAPVEKEPDDLAALADLAKNGPTKDKFPQADAYIALDRRDIALQPDGSVVEKHKTIVRILDAQRGKANFADLHIKFDSKCETLAIAVARTVNPDGTPHEASGEEITDIVPEAIADATTYADLRERVVSFPAVDMGSVLELVYTRTTMQSPDAPLGGEVILGAWDPIKELTVSVSGAGRKLAVVGADLPGKTSGDTTTYSLTDLPDRHPEGGAPPEASVLPRLVYGFQPDWQSAVAPVVMRFSTAATPAVTAAADSAIAGATTDDDKLARLFAYVTQTIRPIDLALGEAGYAPHPADTILANKYADNRDKVALLLAMASAEGLAGEPVFVRGNHVQVVASVPTLAQFDRVLAKVRVGGKDIWLDPSNEASQYAFAPPGQDNLVLPVDRTGELGKRPTLDPSTSVSQTTARFELNANGDLDANYTYVLSGFYAIVAVDELRPLQGDNLVRYFRKGAARLSAAAVDVEHSVGDLTTAHGLTVAQHVTVPQYSQAQGDHRVLELPPTTLGVASDRPDADLATRKYPLLVGAPRIEREDVSITVPAGWKVTYVPPALDGNADGIRYSDKCEATGQTVTCHTEIAIDRVELSTSEYGGFHDAIAKLRAYERRIVVLAKA